MKYKIGDKVRYDGGDWWFYGTVSAVFEHSICPCYRLSVERMEKKSCKFSITQFEFELEAYEEVESGKDKRKWDDTKLQMLLKAEEPKPEKVKKQRRKKEVELKQEVETEKVEVTQKSKISEAWYKNLELYRKGEKSGSIYNWVSVNRKLYNSGELPEDKLEKLNEINFSFASDRKKEKIEKTQKPKKETPKRKRGEAWDINLELYRKGEKNNAISTWIALNRKEYKTGKLSEKKLDKLLEINFPFETVRKKKTIIGTTD